MTDGRSGGRGMGCREVLRALAGPSLALSTQTDDILSHIRACSDCRQIAAAALGAAVSASCPSGDELIDLCSDSMAEEEVESVLARATGCPDCAQTVVDMRELEAAGRAELAVDPAHAKAEKNETTAHQTIVNWDALAGKGASRVKSWLRSVVSDQFWLPVPITVAAIRGVVDGGDEERPKTIQSVPVLDWTGSPLPGTAVLPLAPVSIDERGILEGRFLLTGVDSSVLGSLALYIDLHGPGALRIVQCQAESGDAGEPTERTILFRGAGFDCLRIRIPESEYAVVLEQQD